MNLLALALLLAFSRGHAQPLSTSKQVFGDLQIYRDDKNEKLYYYAPGALKLAMESDGKPRFQLLEMRYTGSSAYGDNGERRFLNIVQFTVSMEQATAEALKAVKKQLPTSDVDLRPLPVRSIEGFLVAPVGEGNERASYKKIGKDGSFQAEGQSGTSDKHGFWTERTFTLKLDNHEAQLLWEQVAKGQLALSFAYSFYANMISRGEGDVTAKENGVRASEFEVAQKDHLTTDTLLITHLVKADAFPVGVDVEKWPDLLKRIDINEGIPPAYAALEVRCFDFANDLRPDLSLKGIDIVATGVGGQPITIPTQKFLSGEPDLFAKQIRFPYAVKLTQPYRYRVIEYTVDGDKDVSEWKTVQMWASHLDITTPAKDQVFETKQIEIELPVNNFADAGVSRVEVNIDYVFAGKHRRVRVEYGHDDTLPVKQTTLRSDKGSVITYEVVWIYQTGTQKSSRVNNLPEDNYLYLMVPD